MTINERLFETMNKKNIKMAELARCLDVNKTVISAWKSRGTNPPIEFTVQICKLLNISIEYYITGKEGQDLSQEEENLLKAYRLAEPAIQTATKKLLDIPEPKLKSETSSTSRTG